MSHNNFRKEPTFGEPSVTNNAPQSAKQVAEKINSEATKIINNLSVSLHSNKAPGHTFTPMMKRPVDATTPLKSIEETQQVKTEINSTESVKQSSVVPENTIEAESIKSTLTTEPEHIKSAAKSAGFAFSPVTEAENLEKNESVKEEKTGAEEKPKMNTNEIERVVPSLNATKPETVAIKAKSSSKYQRLGLVVALAAILAGIFFWLKPNAPETVEELQTQQGGSLPIEFRPVDEEEAKRAEAQAKAEQEALAQQQAQTQSVNGEGATTAVTPEPSATTDMAQSTPTTASSENTLPAENESTIPTTQPSSNTVVAPVVNKPVVNKPVVQPQVSKPKTQGSVIHQAETKKAEVKKDEAKVEKVKAITADEFNAKKAKNVQLDQLVKNVETGKPVVTEKVVAKPAVKPAIAVSSGGVVGSKTLTVPKSTSLMQVFRNNQLNISDVNAMSKVNNVVSNLKVGERVTVRLDKNNRVVEMSIGSGGKFTRQADGSYSFK
ncbi:LysM-like peptidoglycan-binding domain-containing protein [Actinobacillus arthritidis]|uniref:LysM-like peptidoglycan-binding domain-containing protein n=1 Tax=Actinobacillus arthritidis TaxID=157339 RepID=UPI0024422AB6|nr:LysM-like peptidoglycan-binding domain-containing protein [Actinobacillus arthritidis]WGE89293.1 GlcNAc transferase [Actinobacillus arthritidis]